MAFAASPLDFRFFLHCKEGSGSGEVWDQTQVFRHFQCSFMDAKGRKGKGIGRGDRKEMKGPRNRKGTGREGKGRKGKSHETGREWEEGTGKGKGGNGKRKQEGDTKYKH